MINKARSAAASDDAFRGTSMRRRDVIESPLRARGRAWAIAYDHNRCSVATVLVQSARNAQFGLHEVGLNVTFGPLNVGVVEILSGPAGPDPPVG